MSQFCLISDTGNANIDSKLVNDIVMSKTTMKKNPYSGKILGLILGNLEHNDVVIR